MPMSSGPEQAVLFERAGAHVALVTINRSAAHIAINGAVAQDMGAAARGDPGRGADRRRGRVLLRRRRPEVGLRRRRGRLMDRGRRLRRVRVRAVHEAVDRRRERRGAGRRDGDRAPLRSGGGRRIGLLRPPGGEAWADRRGGWAVSAAAGAAEGDRPGADRDRGRGPGGGGRSPCRRASRSPAVRRTSRTPTSGGYPRRPGRA